MIKLNISESMRNFIKETRDKYNMTASELAEKISKSNAFVSKFDKGDYKTISYEDFYLMLNKICKDEVLGKKLVDDYLTNYILNIEDIDELEEDCGLSNYDDVIRFIEIPSELIDFINKEIFENQFKISDIVRKANENNDLPEYTKNLKYQYNVYYPDKEDNTEDINVSSEPYFVKVKLEETVISDILNKKITSINYLTLHALLYTIYRLKNNEKGLSYVIAKDILSKFHFYNLKQKKYSELAEKTKIRAFEEMDNMPTSFKGILCSFANLIFTIFDQNPGYAISKIQGFHHNLSEDPSLVVAMLDLDLYKVKNLSVENKRNLIKEIDQIISKYSDIKPNDKYQLI